jgi:hypothetical protein
MRPPPKIRAAWLLGLDRRWRIALWAALVAAAATLYYWPTLNWPIYYRGPAGLKASPTLDNGDTLHLVSDVIIDDSLGLAGMKRWFTDRIGRRAGGLYAGDGLGPKDTLRIIEDATPHDELGMDRYPKWFDLHWHRDGSFYYRPVLMVSYWLDYRVWGMRAVGSRLTNLVLHIACCLLLGYIVSKMARSWWPGAAAGLVFAVWPENAEVVAWIAARCDLLPFAFTLAAMAMLLAIGPQGERARWLWPLSLLAFLLALGSKETALALVPLLAVWAFLWPVPHRPARRLLVLLSLAALGAGFWAVRLKALGSEPHPLPPIAQLLRPNVLRHYAAFLAKPVVDLFGPNPLRADLLAVFDPSLWKFLGREALFFGAAALLFATCAVPTLAFVAWKAVLYLTVLPTENFWAWPHRFYWPAMGQAALVGLAIWRGGILAAQWAPRLMARLRRIEFRLSG